MRPFGHGKRLWVRQVPAGETPGDGALEAQGIVRLSTWKSASPQVRNAAAHRRRRREGPPGLTLHPLRPHARPARAAPGRRPQRAGRCAASTRRLAVRWPSPPASKPRCMFYVLLAIAEAGAEVVYPNPGFPIYIGLSMIEFSGATAVPMQLLEVPGLPSRPDATAGNGATSGCPPAHHPLAVEPLRLGVHARRAGNHRQCGAQPSVPEMYVMSDA